MMIAVIIEMSLAGTSCAGARIPLLVLNWGGSVKAFGLGLLFCLPKRLVTNALQSVMSIWFHYSSVNRENHTLGIR